MAFLIKVNGNTHSVDGPATKLRCCTTRVKALMLASLSMSSRAVSCDLGIAPSARGDAARPNGCDASPYGSYGSYIDIAAPSESSMAARIKTTHDPRRHERRLFSLNATVLAQALKRS